MKSTPHPRMTPSTLAARCASAAGRLLALMLTFTIVLSDARALSPVAARNDPVKGYLNVDLYPGVTNDTSANPTQPSASVMTATTTGLNTALKDAYEEGYVAYFPRGTYFINNTLKAHTATGGTGGPEFDTPDKSLVIIGEEGSNRPVIKLASNANDFNGAITETSPPKAVVEFMNFEEDDEGVHIPSPNDTSDYRYFWEAPSKGYGQMIRNVIIDCSQSGNNKAIGLYFNQAQNSSIENVKVIATGALAGITGLPGRAWGAVNIEVVGGQYGIDTMPIVRPIYPDDPNPPLSGPRRNLFSTSNSGSVVAGVKLTNQTTAAVRQHGFVPLVLVGFEITSNINQPIMTLVPSGSTGASAVNLIDGKITINRPVGSNTAELINNAARKNLYISNVYVTGTDQLIKYGTNNNITATGTWKRIKEYSARAIPDNLLLDADPGNDAEHKECFNWLDAKPSNFTLPAGTTWTKKNIFEFKTIEAGYTGAVPAAGDLITKHAWALWQLPSPLDAGVVDVTIPGGGLNAVTPSATGMVNSAHLQAIIDAPGTTKVYMPKGIYRLNGPINLKSNTTLIGTARNLTRIEVHPNFPIKLLGGNPTETPIFTTTNSAAATTHLGDLAIGVDVGTATDWARDWFVALHWTAGRNSMVHMGHPYRANPTPFGNRANNTTNPHSLMKITNSGGGRWYFAGAVKTKTAGHPAYRILKVNGTNEPLWIYGLNPEHAVGGTLANSPATYVEFLNSDNIRIYAGKSEFENFQTLDETHPALASRIVWFNGCTNVGMYGHGAIRNGLINKGVMEFTNCDNVVATHITPQLNEWPLNDDHTVRDHTGSAINGVEYPDVVALYKRGDLTDALEEVMTHN